MSWSGALYVIAYDVSDDRERAKVDAILIEFGFRVQKSVFECRLRRHARELLEQRLDALKLASGYVLIYRVVNARRSAAIGMAPPAPDAEAAFVV